MRILLVDDDKDLCHLTKVTLSKHGHEVVTFHEAAGAVQYAKAQKVNLILMDIMLPDMDGAEAVCMFRNDARLKHIPVVFLTGLVSGTEEKAGLTIDGTNYPTLGKPYEIEDLLEIVEANARKQQENG